jgi:hypothetical protein
MPTQRLSMRRIKEVLCLKHAQNLPERIYRQYVEHQPWSSPWLFDAGQELWPILGDAA